MSKTIIDYANAIELIQQNVDIFNLFEVYGIGINKKGMCCCPFHNEKTPSMKVYQKSNSFYCFACGESGDCISFVRKMDNKLFNEAIITLGNIYSLPIEREFTEQDKQRIEKEKKQRKLNQLIKSSEKHIANVKYNYLIRYYKFLKSNYVKYDPKTVKCRHILYIEACKNLDCIEYLLDYHMSTPIDYDICATISQLRKVAEI